MAVRRKIEIPSGGREGAPICRVVATHGVRRSKRIFGFKPIFSVLSSQHMHLDPIDNLYTNRTPADGVNKSKRGAAALL